MLGGFDKRSTDKKIVPLGIVTDLVGGVAGGQGGGNPLSAVTGLLGGAGGDNPLSAVTGLLGGGGNPLGIVWQLLATVFELLFGGLGGALGLDKRILTDDRITNIDTAVINDLVKSVQQIIEGLGGFDKRILESSAISNIDTGVIDDLIKSLQTTLEGLLGGVDKKSTDKKILPLGIVTDVVGGVAGGQGNPLGAVSGLLGGAGSPLGAVTGLVGGGALDGLGLGVLENLLQTVKGTLLLTMIQCKFNTVFQSCLYENLV